MVLTLTAPGDIHQHLRQTTHKAHVRLNQHPLLQPLTRPQLTLDHYQRVLVAYWHFYQLAERLIVSALQQAPITIDYGPRYKLDWLRQDLLHFGINPETVPPPALTLRAPTTSAELLGMMYPLEGSTMGGQLISQRLQKHLGLNAGNGGRFFVGYGPESTPFWNEFLDCLRASILHDKDHQAAGLYARYLFLQLEKFLDGYAP